MNKHLNDGQLRAALDGELDVETQGHLDSCSVCQARQRILQVQVAATAHRLAFLTLEQKDETPSAQSRLNRFYSQKIFEKEIPDIEKNIHITYRTVCGYRRIDYGAYYYHPSHARFSRSGSQSVPCGTGYGCAR